MSEYFNGGDIEPVSTNNDDIPQLKQVEEQLLDSGQDLFRLAFDDAAIGMALVAPDGKWLKVNRALCEIVGYSQTDLLGTTFQEITHPDDLETDLGYVGKMLAGEIRTYQMEKRYFHSSGHIVWILLSVSLVRDKNQQPLYFISQIQDITPRKQAEARLKSLVIELERSNRDLEDFASVVSHDLISPLHKIQILSEYLKEDYSEVLDKQGIDYLNRISQVRIRMQSLIEDLLSFSLVTTQGQLFTEVDLNKVILLVISDLQADGFTDVSLDIDELPTISADSGQMYQLFQNILSNAIRFARPDVIPKIAISAQPYGQGYLFAIQDNGVGIPPDQHERIFEIFQRGKAAKETPGTGIGLATCKKIVEGHGGAIWVDSELEKGTTFYFTLQAV